MWLCGGLCNVNNFESAIFLACCWSFDNLHEKGVVYVVQGSNQREDDLLPFIAAVKRAACWDFDNFWFMSSSSSRCEFINCTLQWSKACFAKPCHVCIGLSHLLLLLVQAWQKVSKNTVFFIRNKVKSELVMFLSFPKNLH